MEQVLSSVTQTPSARVAAEQASLLSCPFCQTRDLSQIQCLHCGLPQPARENESFFRAFGLPLSFRVDLKALEKTFYTLSRELHPDRFVNDGLEVKQASLERMSWLNQAYQTLKNPQDRREALLKELGFSGEARPPMDLASEWFEVQEEAMESPQVLSTFRNKVLLRREGLLRDLEKLESSYDQSSNRELLQKIFEASQTLNYLKSLERDIDRIQHALVS